MRHGLAAIASDPCCKASGGIESGRCLKAIRLANGFNEDCHAERVGAGVDNPSEVMKSKFAQKLRRSKHYGLNDEPDSQVAGCIRVIGTASPLRIASPRGHRIAVPAAILERHRLSSRR